MLRDELEEQAELLKNLPMTYCHFKVIRGQYCFVESEINNGNVICKGCIGIGKDCESCKK